MWVLFDLACIGFFFSLVLSPVVRDLANRRGWVDKPDGKRKIHARPVPRVGGVAIAIAYVLALAFVFLAPYRNLTIDISVGLSAALSLLPAVGVVFLTGLADDFIKLKPWQKLVGETLAAVMAYWAGFGIHLFRGETLEVWVSLPVTVLWLVGCANALNLIDGMDGLAAGISFFATMTMLVAALTNQALPLAMVTAPLAGALLGFLRYNFNPASVFLGDAGSLSIGFLLGCYGALWSHKSATILGMTAPLMALAIPILDTGLAVARRFLRGQPIFGADRGHIHHRLLDQGVTPRRAVLILYAVCGAAAAASLIFDATKNQFAGAIIVLFCGAAWIGIQHLGYAEFGLASRLLLRGQLRGMIDVQLRLQQFDRELRGAADIDVFWRVLDQGCREFGFRGARLKLNGRLFVSDHIGERPQALWQLRMPLGDDQYLNVFRDADASMHPVVLADFAQIVETATQRLQSSLHKPCAGVVGTAPQAGTEEEKVAVKPG